MAYDEELAERVRQLVLGEPGLTEKKMFGGLAFLIGGNMTVAARAGGGLMVRVAEETGARLIDSKKAEPVVMRGRPMSGWLAVPSGDVYSRDRLRQWIERGVDFARTLPVKE